MPVNYHLGDDGILVIEGVGRVTDAEYFAAHAEFLAIAQPADPVRRTLADWSGVDDMELTANAVQTSVAMTRQHVARVGGRHRLAILALTPVIFGLCRMWEMLIEGSGAECMIFRDRAAALEWLRA